MIALILGLALVGVVLYLIEQIPMDSTIKLLIRIVVVICVVYYLATLFGVQDLPLPGRGHR